MRIKVILFPNCKQQFYDDSCICSHQSEWPSTGVTRFSRGYQCSAYVFPGRRVPQVTQGWTSSNWKWKMTCQDEVKTGKQRSKTWESDKITPKICSGNGSEICSCLYRKRKKIKRKKKKEKKNKTSYLSITVGNNLSISFANKEVWTCLEWYFQQQEAQTYVNIAIFVTTSLFPGEWLHLLGDKGLE